MRKPRESWKGRHRTDGRKARIIIPSAALVSLAPSSWLHTFFVSRNSCFVSYRLCSRKRPFRGKSKILSETKFVRICTDIFVSFFLRARLPSGWKYFVARRTLFFFSRQWLLARDINYSCKLTRRNFVHSAVHELTNPCTTRIPRTRACGSPSRAMHLSLSLSLALLALLFIYVRPG